MFSLRAVKVPAQTAALVVAVLVSGCASTGYFANSASQDAFDEVGRFAGLSPRPWVETEGDGREAQLPPRRRLNQSADDPTEPFSPNYGTVVPASVPSQWTVTIVRERA